MAPSRVSDHVRLPSDLVAPTAAPADASPTRILLTGATGFLGGYLLVSLLQRTSARVVCLVRAADLATARKRLEGNADQYGLTIDFARVDVRLGAVDQPQLGWDEPTWASEAELCDTIMHAAANVSFLPNFDRLRPVNVDSVTTLLRLAAAARPKRVHLVSTYAIFNAAEYNGTTLAREEPARGDGTGFRRGYPASKWAAERLGGLARDRGWNVTVHRAGLLWGDLQTGQSKSDDILALNLDACRTLGVAQDIDFLMHLTPVDFAAGAIAAVVSRPEHSNEHYHVVTEHAVPWRDVVAALARLGHPVRLVTPAEWFEALRAALPAHPEWGPLYWLLSQDPRRSFWQDANIFGLAYDASRLRRALQGTGVVCPKLDDAALRVYLAAFGTMRTLSGARGVSVKSLQSPRHSPAVRSTS